MSQAKTVGLLPSGQVDMSSIDAILAATVLPGMTDREKAFAVFEFVRDHFYHWISPREGESFESGVVFDPIKLLNVYGYGYCFQNRSILEALWQAAGLEARTAGIGGHSIAEVYYDDAWHYFDADQASYCLLPDGQTVASIDQVAADPVGLLLEQPNPSTPFFASTNDPKMFYESRYALAAYFNCFHHRQASDLRMDHFYQNDKFSLGHRMDLVLKPGMRFTKHATGDGRWNAAVGLNEYAIGYCDPAIGPKDFHSDVSYACGELLFQPDLTSRSNEFACNVWLAGNVVPAENGLVQDNSMMDGYCVFKIDLPYPVVAWSTRFDDQRQLLGGAVVEIGASAGAVRVEHSLDGVSWAELELVERRCDFSEHVFREYGFYLRLRLSDGACVEHFSLRLACQIAPNTFPALVEGENQMQFRVADAVYTQLLDHEFAQGSWQDDVICHNLELDGCALYSISEEPGELIYELAAPQNGQIIGFHADLGFWRKDIPAGDCDDGRLLWSVDGATWIEIGQLKLPSYAEHLSSHLNCELNLETPRVKIYVKAILRTAPSYGLRQVKLHLRWIKDELTAEGYEIVHAWRDSEGVQQYQLTVTEDTDYIVPVKQLEENLSVCIAPCRYDGLVWRDDAAFCEPPTPEPGYLDPARRDHLREVLRLIDAKPRKGAAVACEAADPALAQVGDKVKRLLNDYPDLDV